MLRCTVVVIRYCHGVSFSNQLCCLFIRMILCLGFRLCRCFCLRFTLRLSLKPSGRKFLFYTVRQCIFARPNQSGHCIPCCSQTVLYQFRIYFAVTKNNIIANSCYDQNQKKKNQNPHRPLSSLTLLPSRSPCLCVFIIPHKHSSLHCTYSYLFSTFTSRDNSF